MKWSGNALRIADFSSAAAPLFHWHCRWQDKGAKNGKNEEKIGATPPSSFFLCSFCENFSANLANADLASYNQIVPSFGNSRWWATPGGAGGGTLFLFLVSSP